MNHLSNFYKHKAEQLQEKYNKLCVLLEQSAGMDFSRMAHAFSFMPDAEFESFIRDSTLSDDAKDQLRDQRRTAQRARGVEPSEMGKAKDFYRKHKEGIKGAAKTGATVIAGLPLAYAANYGLEDTPEVVKQPIVGAAMLGSGQAAAEVATKATERFRGTRTPPRVPDAPYSKWTGTPLGRIGTMGGVGALGGLISVPVEKGVETLGLKEPSMAKDVAVAFPTVAITQGLLDAPAYLKGKMTTKGLLRSMGAAGAKWGLAAPIAMTMMMDKVAGAEPYPIEDPTEEQKKAAEEYEEERKRKWEEEHGPSKPLDMSPMFGSDVSAATQRISSKAKQRAEDVYSRQNY